jgi:fatty-acyl-CoA synthase
MRRTVIGGSACAPAMMRTFQDRYDVQVLPAWGLTEMDPPGAAGAFKSQHGAASDDERLAEQARAVFGVDMKIVGEVQANKLHERVQHHLLPAA